MVDNDARYIKFILKHLSHFKFILQRSKHMAIKQSQTYAPLLSRKFQNGVEYLRWQTMTHLPNKLCDIHLHIHRYHYLHDQASCFKCWCV